MELWNEILKQLHFIPQTIIVACLLIMSYMFVVDNQGHIKKRILELLKQRYVFFFLIYTAFLFTITILARFISKPIHSGLGAFGFFINGRLNTDGIINVALFIPYSFLYIKAFYPASLKTIISLVLCSTIAIEVFQFVFWAGQFTIADIVHNTIGGIIGYALLMFSEFVIRIKRKKKSVNTKKMKH